ncbi:MAG: ABC transporter permease [Eubacteriales bacterium]
MFFVILKKELKSFITSKGNLAVMILLPILLLMIFGYALGNYMNADYHTFDAGTMFYFVDTDSSQAMEHFEGIVEEINRVTGVIFAEVDQVEVAKSRVEESEAYGLITIHDTEYSYFRSTFNEPEGGELVRNLFVQLANHTSFREATSSSIVEREVVQGTKIDSIGYYTFSSLAFSILFMGLIVGFSMQNEKILGTLERIKLSKAGMGSVFLAKIVMGIICGIGQILVVFISSNLLFKVSWGEYTGIMFALFLLLAIYSAVFGGVMGVLCKSKASCQSNVLMLSMLSGYFGGAITPLYLLENTAFMNIVIHCSPLYWFNSAIVNLQNNILDYNTRNACFVLTGLIVGLLCLLGIRSHKSATNRTGKVGRTA